MTRALRRPVPSLREAARQVIGVTLASCAAGAVVPAASATEKLTAQSVFTRADVNRDGHLSRAEVQRFPVFAEKFDQFDSNHDGRLDSAEFDVAFNAPQ